MVRVCGRIKPSCICSVTNPHSSSSISVSVSESDSSNDMKLASELSLPYTGISLSTHLLMQVSTGLFGCISFWAACHACFFWMKTVNCSWMTKLHSNLLDSFVMLEDRSQASSKKHSAMHGESMQWQQKLPKTPLFSDGSFADINGGFSHDQAAHKCVAWNLGGTCSAWEGNHPCWFFWQRTPGKKPWKFAFQGDFSL